MTETKKEQNLIQSKRGKMVSKAQHNKGKKAYKHLLAYWDSQCINILQSKGFQVIPPKTKTKTKTKNNNLKNVPKKLRVNLHVHTPK